MNVSRLGLLLATAALACDGGAPNTEAVTPPSPEPHVDVQPGPPTLRRLTQAQYYATVRDLLGDLDLPAALEPDAEIDGLASLGAAVAGVSPRGVEQYETGALNLAAQAVRPEHRERIFSCAPADINDASCFRQALTDLGGLAWRRPLSAEEVDPLVSVALLAASTQGDPWSGLEYGTAALLQSPSFLFRVEVGEPSTSDPSRLQYTNYEMASRLSYALWGTMPDAELFDAAANAELTTDEGLRVQATRMMGSPKARAGVRAFFTELFALGELASLSKDPLIFNNMSPSIGAAMTEETLQLLEHIVFDTPSGDYRQLLTTRTTFVDRELAALYGVQAPTLEGFGQVEHPADSLRRGIMGQASFLAHEAHPVRSSITKRGKFIRTKLLCHIIPAPPADVDTSIPEATAEATSLRDRIEIHLSNPACAACHSLTDPIGLALENFDGIGAFRTNDNGEPIDPSGDLDGLVYDDPVQLAEVLYDHEDIGSCFTDHFARYAWGRELTDSEEPAAEALSAWFEAEDYNVQGLMMQMVTSPAFRHLEAAPTGEEG